MPAHQPPGAHAARPGRADVVAPELVDHGGTGDPRIGRQRQQPQRDGGHDEMGGRPGARGRQPAQPDPEHEDHHDAGPEGRHRLAGQHQPHDPARHRALPGQRHREAQRQADQHRHRERPRRELQGLGNAAQDDVPDAGVLDEGAPEVEARHVPEEFEVLHPEGAIEAKRRAHGLDVRLRRGLGQQQGGRVAGQALDEEDQRDHPERRHQGLSAAQQEEAQHVTRPRSCG